MPSSPIFTNTNGLSTVPFGIPAAPYMGASAALTIEPPSAINKSPPTACSRTRNSRRLNEPAAGWFVGTALMSMDPRDQRHA
jgi:hypothetical protein